MKAVKKLRQDKTRIILTAYKGVALVVLGKTGYINKAEKLLEDGGTDKKIVTDPTNRFKNRLANLQKKIKSGGISDILYKKMYPTGAHVPKFYGLPKVHERHHVKTTYKVTKELTRILRPLVANPPSY